MERLFYVNSVEGVTHLIYHTYTHNPKADSLPPGTSFGAKIGTPFLRQQTWWKEMPQLNSYFARCSYMLERGKPVSDVLWYLGDEIDHKPDQNLPFPEGFKYDYCNTDVLLNRLSVENGMLVTPEGINYKVLWLPQTKHMLPQTLEKLESFIRAGATVIGNCPQALATLSGGMNSQMRFDKAVKNIWGSNRITGFKKLGKGTIITGVGLAEALNKLQLSPDVIGGDALWTHRKINGADWYFVTSPRGKPFKGTLDFKNTGDIELWDPVNGGIKPVAGLQKEGRTSVSLDLPEAGSCFVVFYHDKKEISDIKPIKTNTIAISKVITPWNLSFPAGWGAPQSVKVDTLKPWKDLNISSEARAFSGTATYTTTFDVSTIQQGMHFSINLGQVNMIAKVSINGKNIGTVWCSPYQLDITDGITSGKNSLKVEITSTWFNRLAYDASLPEDKRKTWTISGPAKESPLRDSGLLGPVTIVTEKEY